jgi:hypothetical protein
VEERTDATLDRIRMWWSGREQIEGAKEGSLKKRRREMKGESKGRGRRKTNPKVGRRRDRPAWNRGGRRRRGAGDEERDHRRHLHLFYPRVRRRRLLSPLHRRRLLFHLLLHLLHRTRRESRHLRRFEKGIATSSWNERRWRRGGMNLERERYELERVRFVQRVMTHGRLSARILRTAAVDGCRYGRWS